MVLGSAAEGQDLLHKLLCPLCPLQDLIEFLPLFFRVFILHHGQLGIPEDDGENIVEVVGDAAGQGADGLHLLGLTELDFQSLPFLLRAVPVADIAGKGAIVYLVVIDDAGGAHLHRKVLAFLGAVHGFKGCGAFLQEFLPVFRPFFRWEGGVDIKNPQGKKFFLGIAETPAGACVDQMETCLFIDQEDAVLGTVDGKLRQIELFLPLLFFGDVFIDPEHAIHPALFVLQRHLGGVDPDSGAVGLLQRFDDGSLGSVGGDDLPVIGPVCLGFLLGPGQIKIGFPLDPLRIIQPDGLGKHRIAPQIDALSVFPENGLGGHVQNLPEHEAMLAQCFFGLPFFLDIGEQTPYGTEQQKDKARKAPYFHPVIFIQADRLVDDDTALGQGRGFDAKSLELEKVEHGLYRWLGHNGNGGRRFAGQDTQRQLRGLGSVCLAPQEISAHHAGAHALLLDDIDRRS